LKIGHEGNFIKRFKDANRIKKQGLNVNVSYKTVLGGIEEKIENIAKEIEQPGEEPHVIFDPNAEKMFSLSEGKDALVVDREKLYSLIDEALQQQKQVEIEI